MNSNSEFGPVNSLANLPEGNFDPEFYNRCVDIGILAYSMRPSREGPVIHIEQVLEFLSAYRFDVACKSITPIDSYGNQERGWKWFRVEFPSEYEAESCVAACNFPGRPLRFEYYRERFPVIVTMTSFGRNENAHDGKHDVVQFETMDLYPHDVIVVDTQEGLVCFSTADIYRTKGADDYMFAKKESGKIIRRLVCKHFDPVSGTLCKFGIMCSFVHVKKGKINRLLKVTSPYQELRPPKFEDDIQLSTWEFDRRHDTLVLRNLSKSLNGDDIKYMFSECEGYTGSFIRKEGNRVTAVILFNSTEAATSALLQTRDTGLNISFYGVMEDLRTLILQESRSKKEITRPLGRLAPDGSQIRNTCETNGDCNNDRVTKRDRSEPEEYSELPQSEASAVTEETEMKPSLEQPQNVFEMKDAAPINDKHEVSDCDHATSNCGT